MRVAAPRDPDSIPWSPGPKLSRTDVVKFKLAVKRFWDRRGKAPPQFDVWKNIKYEDKLLAGKDISNP